MTCGRRQGLTTKERLCDFLRERPAGLYERMAMGFPMQCATNVADGDLYTSACGWCVLLR